MAFRSCPAVLLVQPAVWPAGAGVACACSFAVVVLTSQADNANVVASNDAPINPIRTGTSPDKSEDTTRNTGLRFTAQATAR
jgi:hypothetical protein